MITPTIVRGLWAFLAGHYKTKVKAKATSAEVRVIAQMLDQMGVVDAGAFLTRQTTTLGKTIYIPFRLGVATPVHSLEHQLVTGAHEHQHVVQMNKDGLSFAAGYTLDTVKRTAYEAEAYRVTMTLTYYLNGSMPAPAEYAELMKNYGVTAKDRDFLAEYLRISIPAIRAGGIPDEATRLALQWIRAQAPQILVV